MHIQIVSRDNESEYFNTSAQSGCKMLLREAMVDDGFKNEGEVKKIESENTPPIINLDRDKAQAQCVIYYKSLLLLSDLEQQIGSHRFLLLNSDCKSRGIISTTSLLDHIGHYAGQDIVDWIKRNMKTR